MDDERWPCKERTQRKLYRLQSMTRIRATHEKSPACRPRSPRLEFRASLPENIPLGSGDCSFHVQHLLSLKQDLDPAFASIERLQPLLGSPTFRPPGSQLKATPCAHWVIKAQARKQSSSSLRKFIFRISTCFPSQIQDRSSAIALLRNQGRPRRASLHPNCLALLAAPQLHQLYESLGRISAGSRLALADLTSSIVCSDGSRCGSRLSTG